MDKIKPRHVICALGNWTDFASIKAALKGNKFGFELDTEYSVFSPNPRMLRSFTVNQDRLPNSLQEKDWDAIKRHNAVAYILSPAIDDDSAEEISGNALNVIVDLFNTGATAIQSESAGLSHGKEKWRALANQYSQAKKKREMISQEGQHFIKLGFSAV